MDNNNRKLKVLSPASNSSLAGLEDLFSQAQANKVTKLEANPSRQAEPQATLLRPEMHMFLWPYFVIDKNADRSKPIKIIEFVKVGDEKLARRWEVTPHSDYGMPGSLDCNVLLALYEIAYDDYLSKGLEVPDMMPIGSWRSFMKRLGLTVSGRTQTQVVTALKRLVHTTCHSENSFLDKKNTLYVTESFSLIQAVGFKGDLNGNQERIKDSFVSFHPRIQNNLNARYLMILDRSFYNSLKTDIAKHLYPLLSYWFYRSRDKEYWRVDYLWLVNRLGLKGTDTLWRAKRQLQKANEELVSKGFIFKYEWDSWGIQYYPGPVFNGEQLRRSTAKAELKGRPKQLTLTLSKDSDNGVHDKLLPVLNIYAQGLPMADKELAKHGITAEQARTLCIERNIPLNRLDA